MVTRLKGRQERQMVNAIYCQACRTQNTHSPGQALRYPYVVVSTTNKVKRDYTIW